MLHMKRAWVSETRPWIFPGVMGFWENNKQEMAGGCVRSGTSHSWLQQIKGSVPSPASLSMWWLWLSSALARPSRALEQLPHKWRLVEMIWPPPILQVSATTQQSGAEPGPGTTPSRWPSWSLRRGIRGLLQGRAAVFFVSFTPP